MTPMDGKGVSWVGNMCQRFEALYVDVDEKIYEDTFVYVGNQMRTVGENVKKFYSEVVQDLLASSSLDSEKVKHPPVTRDGDADADICKKQNLVNESELVNSASEIMGKKSAEEQCITENSQSQLVDLASNKSCTVTKQLSSDQEQLLKLLADLRKDYAEELARIESVDGREKSLCECGNVNAIEASDVKVCKHNENEAEISGDAMERYVSDIAVNEMQTKGASVEDVSTELNNSLSSMKVVMDTTITDNVLDAVEVDDKLSLSDAGADKQQCLKLGESCVFVENDGLFSSSGLENVQKSYKKKIREAFSRRRWSKSKRDEDRLVGRYEGPSVKSIISSCTRHSEIQESPIPESLDSEWELL